jgi:hypothetical protein
VHAEETLASLNFAPDSFSHDTATTQRMKPDLSKELDMKILDLEDKYYHRSTRPHSTQIYFVSSFPKDGDAEEKQ